MKTKTITTIDISVEYSGYKEIVIERLWRFSGEASIGKWTAYFGVTPASLRRCQRAQLALLKRGKDD